jgi:thiol-disulfide isomerase/thioredoxin
MTLVNQYSFLWITALALGLTAYFLLRLGKPEDAWLPLGALAAGLILAFMLFSPGRQAVVPGVDVEGQIGVGTPVLLEFQSPYCIACMAAKPLVDQIEKDHAGRLVVLRLNAQDASRRTLAARFGFAYTPTFVLLDADGQMLMRRVGAIDPAEVAAALGEP